MTTNPSGFDPLWMFRAPWSGDVAQRITAPWFSPSLTVNYAGDPAVEDRVVTEVASYGKQLGWLTEIAIALAKREPLPRGNFRPAGKGDQRHRCNQGASRRFRRRRGERRSRPTGTPRPCPISEAPARTEECQVVLNFNSATSSICSPSQRPAGRPVTARAAANDRISAGCAAPARAPRCPRRSRLSDTRRSCP